jgi:hypothetical protein
MHNQLTLRIVHGLDTPSGSGGERAMGTQDNGTDGGSDHSESEAEMSTPIGKPGTSTPVNPTTPVCMQRGGLGHF